MDHYVQIHHLTVSFLCNRGIHICKEVTLIGIELFYEGQVFFKLLWLEGFKRSSEQTESKK